MINRPVERARGYSSNEFEFEFPTQTIQSNSPGSSVKENKASGGVAINTNNSTAAAAVPAPQNLVTKRKSNSLPTRKKKT